MRAKRAQASLAPKALVLPTLGDGRFTDQSLRLTNTIGVGVSELDPNRRLDTFIFVSTTRDARRRIN